MGAREIMTKQVLIFDSGVGGLSIYQQVIAKNPTLNCSYLFDNACFPYGELQDDFLIKRLTGLLISFIEKQPVDLIIIACNTASTVALSALRHYFSIPVVGVVPAIKPAAKLSKNRIIGLLATPATIRRSYTDRLIDEFAAHTNVLKIGSTALVKLAEDKLHGLDVDKKALRKILAPWLSLAEKPDTVVLGCTHFPLLKDEIKHCFDNKVQLVDSGKAIANRVALLLGDSQPTDTKAKNQHRAYYTQSYGYAVTESTQLTALHARFLDYGFQSLDYYQYINSKSTHYVCI